MATQKIRLPSAAEMAAFNKVQTVLGEDIAGARDEYAQTCQLEQAKGEANDALKSNKEGTLTYRIRAMAIKATREGVPVDHAAALLYAAMVEVAPADDKGRPKAGTAKAFTNAFKGWCAMAADQAAAILEGEEPGFDTEEATANEATAYIASPEVKELQDLRKAIATEMKASNKSKDRLTAILGMLKAYNAANAEAATETAQPAAQAEAA